MNQAAPHGNLDRIDEINILDLAQRLLARWPIILACMILASAAGVLTLRYSAYTYTAEMKVTPVQANGQGSLSQLGQLGGLASLVGVALPRSDATPFFLYVESVASRAVADQLATDPEMMKRLFKSEWDASNNRYVERPTTLDSIANSLRETFGIPTFPWTPPDGARLQIYVQTSVEVTEDTRKPIVTLKYDNEDPAFAVAFLAALDRAIDSELRKKTLERVNENIAYLSQQLTSVRLAEHRQAIIDMLSEQEKSRMMASSTAPIAAETVSGPTSSFRPTKPRQLLVIAATVLAGFLLGCIVALIWEWFAYRRRTSSGGIVPVPANFIQSRVES